MVSAPAGGCWVQLLLQEGTGRGRPGAPGPAGSFPRLEPRPSPSAPYRSLWTQQPPRSWHTAGSAVKRGSENQSCHHSLQHSCGQRRDPRGGFQESKDSQIGSWKVCHFRSESDESMRAVWIRRQESSKVGEREFVTGGASGANRALQDGRYFKAPEEAEGTATPGAKGE